MHSFLYVRSFSDHNHGRDCFVVQVLLEVGSGLF